MRGEFFPSMTTISALSMPSHTYLLDVYLSQMSSIRFLWSAFCSFSIIRQPIRGSACRVCSLPTANACLQILSTYNICFMPALLIGSSTVTWSHHHGPLILQMQLHIQLVTDADYVSFVNCEITTHFRLIVKAILFSLSPMPTLAWPWPLTFEPQNTRYLQWILIH